MSRRISIPDDASDWSNLAMRVAELEMALARGTVVAKGVRYTTFDVASGIPGSTFMPFESSPSSPADSQQYESHQGMLNTATGVITLPEDGVYAAAAFFTFGSALAAGTTLDLMILADLFGSGPQRVAEARGPASTLIKNASGQFAAEAGDTVSLVIGHNVGSTQASGAGSTMLPWYLAVHKIRGPL